MRRRTGRLSLILGLLLLVVLIAAGYLYLSSTGLFGRREEAAPLVATPPPTPIPMVRVLVANRAIPAETILTPQMAEDYFEVREIPRTEVTVEDVVSSKAQLLDKVTRVALQPGQIVSARELAEVTLSFVIPEDKRAVPLKVDEFSGVVGRIAAKDYVDIVIGGQIELHYPQPFPPLVEEGFVALSPVSLLSVKTVLQDIMVLEVISITTPEEEQGQPRAQPTPTPGVEGEVAPPTPPKPTAWILILAVTDQQAEVLKFAQDQGMTYQLILRPRGDHTLSTTTGITTKILIDTYGLPVPKHIRYEIDPRDVPSGSIP